VRALVVTNMYPTPERPALGVFVRDQVEALRRLGVDVEVFSFGPGSPAAYLAAANQLRKGSERYDVVHAHFGLTAWPALAARGRRRVVTLHGTDATNPRSRAITRAALPRYDLVAAVSEELSAIVPTNKHVVVLPCGVDTGRFRSIPRPEARAQLGLDPEGPYVLFPADPARPEKRFELARSAAGDTRLLALERVDPADVPLWVNAANAVVVPSEREGFGLSVLEALACDVPVLATPVGIAPEALAGIEGTYCAPFEADAWRAALAPHLSVADPRIEGRARAEGYSADRMAERVLRAWQSL
jgi:glycosyltransferase involved in cell wall biosynthesis